jgi:hypothetical protein
MKNLPSNSLIVSIIVLVLVWGGGGLICRDNLGGYRGYGLGWVILVVVILWLLAGRPF